MGNSFCQILSAMVMAVLLVVGAREVSADHRGALSVLGKPATNINDVYAFVDPNDTSKLVLAMTVNGYTVSGVNPVFAPDCLYQFKIDNTGDFVEDLVIQIIFDPPTGEAFAPTQGFTVIGPIKPPKVGAINRRAVTKALPITGIIVNVPVTGAGHGVPVNTFTAAANGMSVFCGVRDDAFTFDDIFIRNIFRGTLTVPNPAETRNPGIDFIARFNCSTIAIEVPSALLTGPLVNAAVHHQLNIWATTSVPSVVLTALKTKRGEPPLVHETDGRSFVQHDRVAHPCVSTFLIDEASKDTFSQGQPRDDAKFFTTQATAHIEKLQLDPTSNAAIAAKANLLAIRFPDVLRLDVTSTAGFDVDNGRRPQDDVVSYELGLLTVGAVTNEGISGSNGRVGGNDATFVGGSSTTPGVFPFFAPPHVPAQPVPARN